MKFSIFNFRAAGKAFGDARQFSIKKAFKSRRLLIISLLILLFFAVPAYLISSHPRQTQAAWFNDSWLYRKAIAIPSHTSAENNVYVTVPAFDATDTSKFQADCGDLRFTNQNGELLAYYVVDCDATADIHVLFDTLPAGASTYYMYYGNPSAPNGFSGADFPNAASGLGTQALAAEEKSPGPVAYWKFDEGYGSTAYDSTQNGNNGTLGAGNSAPTWQTEDMCMSGKCLKFDGSNDYVNFADSSSLDATSAISISTWVKLNSTTGNQVFVSKYGVSGQRSYMLYKGSDNTLEMLVSQAGSTFIQSCSASDSISWNTSTWYHIVGVFNPSVSLKVYRNGQEITCTPSGAIPSSVFNSTTALWIGNAVGYNNPLNGFIDDVKIYPYARSAAQIKADYASGKAHAGTSEGTSASLGANKDQGDFLNQGLVGYWKMDTGVGTTEPDYSGNSNTVTLGIGSSAPTWASGKFGNGLDFEDSSSQYISRADTNSLSVISSFTISSWIKLESTSNEPILAKDASSNTSFYLNIVSSKIRFLLTSNGSTQVYRDSNTTLTTGTWYYVTGTYNSVTQTMDVFLNGANDNSTLTGTIPSSVYDGNADVRIGSDERLGVFYDGLLDDVRIYNRALSLKEVRDLYNWAPGPVGYWMLDEKSGVSAYDSSTYADSGTISGASWTQGKFGSALNHNGSSNYVYAKIGSWLGVSSRAWTASAWFNSPDSGGPIFGVTSSPPGGGWTIPFLSLSSGGLLFGYSWGGGQISCSTSFGQWHHGGVVYDPSNGLKLYLDGVLCNSSTNTGYSASGATDYWTTYVGGTKPSNVPSYFKGKIDDVKIYNYARSAKQIIEDMNAGHPAVGSPVGSAVAHYKFDEGYGSTANNSGNSGSTLNGTLGTGNSAPTWSNDGKFGKALSFDGGNDKITFGTTDITAVKPTDGITITTWVKYSSDHFIRWLSQSKDVNTSAYEAGTDYTDNAKYRFILNSTSVLTTTRTASLLGSWVHLSFVYDKNASSNNAKIYENGKLLGSANYSTTIDYTGSGWQLSTNRLGKTDGFFSGLSDEVKIYNYALTEDEVKLDYNQGKALVLGALSSGTGNTAPENAASQEYCVPGDTTSCAAPVARWDFNEGVGTTAYDSSGNSNHGTLGAGTSAPSWTAGKVGKGLRFDGVDDYVDAGNSNSLDLTNYTLSAWIRTTSTEDLTIISNYQDVSNHNYFFVIDNGGDVQLYSGTWLVGNNTVGSVTDGKWHHIVGVRSGSTGYIYIDGKLDKSGAVGSAASTTISTNIGRSPTSSGTKYPFNGLIDQVRIYNYARSPAQIAWDYNRGGPVGWWKFDECQGATAYDSIRTGATIPDGTITIGGTGTQSVLGTCSVGTGTTAAWGNGSVGKYNSSLNFDGTNDYVSVGDISAVELGSVSFTGWIKLAAINDDEDFMTKGVHSTNSPLVIWRDDVVGSGSDAGNTNTLSVILYDGTTQDWYAAPSESLNDTNWHHLVVSIVPNSEMKIYIDGILKRTGDITGNNGIQNTAVGLRIGADSNGSVGFNGQIDDVKIFNYALTSTQVKTLYNQGSAVQFGPVTGSQ